MLCSWHKLSRRELVRLTLWFFPICIHFKGKSLLQDTVTKRTNVFSRFFQRSFARIVQRLPENGGEDAPNSSPVSVDVYICVENVRVRGVYLTEYYRAQSALYFLQTIKMSETERSRRKYR